MRGERGIVGANLVIVLAFALFAVIELTRTTIAAKQIRDRVEIITGEVSPIASELTNVPKLDETVRIAAEINTAARPLSGQLDQVIAAARSIDNSASNIQSNANDINGTVDAINSNGNGILGSVREINQGVKAIIGRVDRILAPVSGIGPDVRNILEQVRIIDLHANSIDCSPAVQGRSCGR